MDYRGLYNDSDLCQAKFTDMRMEWKLLPTLVESYKHTLPYLMQTLRRSTWTIIQPLQKKWRNKKVLSRVSNEHEFHSWVWQSAFWETNWWPLDSTYKRNWIFSSEAIWGFCPYLQLEEQSKKPLLKWMPRSRWWRKTIPNQCKLGWGWWGWWRWWGQRWWQPYFHQKSYVSSPLLLQHTLLLSHWMAVLCLPKLHPLYSLQLVLPFTQLDLWHTIAFNFHQPLNRFSFQGVALFVISHIHLENSRCSVIKHHSQVIAPILAFTSPMLLFAYLLFTNLKTHCWTYYPCDCWLDIIYMPYIFAINNTIGHKYVVWIDLKSNTFNFDTKHLWIQ